MIEAQIIKNDDVLWKKYSITKDIATRNEIIEKYSYIVKIIAIRIRGMYQQYGDMDDVINEGILALIDAINKFDLSKNTKFETYASIRVKGAIIDYCRRQAWTPRRVNRNKKLIESAEKELSNKLGRNPTEKEIASYLDIDVISYNKIIAETYNVNLLSFEDMINQLSTLKTSGVNDSSPEDNFIKKELQSVLANAIDKLNEKEKLLISLYYKEEIKLKDIANLLNISNSRASQIHSRALQKLNIYIKKYLEY
ncbi:FliA/WhiG family RNA polymerase sigma factor [Sedimentibacter sp. zth1]|nr:FliA/WhiG family RNA polymerase sigma factor [Sedimentibacter sp. zth1]